MAYGTNAPFGLRAVSHLIGGADDIKTNSNYTIDVTTASTLNNGDPVVYAPSIADYATAGYYKGATAVITRMNPTVTLDTANTATTVVKPPVAGVFQSCQYWVNGTFYEQQYWVAGTAATSTVKAFVVDDPYVIWDVQLGTYMGSVAGTTSRFLLLPSMQLQNATWPNTGGAAANPTAANSAIIGSNLELLTGRGPAAGAAGGSGSLTTVTAWDGTQAVVAGYADNPLIANYGSNTLPANPLGTSTFYACPSLAATNASPSVADGRNEYARDEEATLKVIGFSPNPENVPTKYGLPANGTPGTYFNTPFLNVWVMINNHVNKAGVEGVIPTA